MASTRKIKDTPVDIYEEADISGESEEDLIGVTPHSLSEAVVWGTDWTAGTIVDQLRKGTIKLDPIFQRRDAWTDERKSRFIESLMLGLPIPQLVLAENAKFKGKFIVIDGKQRLLSLAKFTGVGLAEGTPLKLTGLNLLKQVNKHTYEEIEAQSKFQDLVSSFENQAIRTVVIRGWKSEEVLYTIFHRLNTGSVPLSPQELRQALHPGDFLTFAATYSEESKPIKDFLNLKGPDFRMRDVELVVRHMAFAHRLNQYQGNLKQFLDDTCDHFNKHWVTDSVAVRSSAIQLDLAIEASFKIFSKGYAFKKWDGEHFEKQLNRAVFDVISCSLLDPDIRSKAVAAKGQVQSAFKKLCEEPKFRSAIETTTKSKGAVKTRFESWFSALGQIVHKTLPLSLPPS